MWILTKFIGAMCSLVLLAACAAPPKTQVSLTRGFHQSTFGKPGRIGGRVVYPLVIYSRFVRIDEGTYLCAGMISAGAPHEEKFIARSEFVLDGKTVQKHPNYLYDLNAAVIRKFGRPNPGNRFLGLSKSDARKLLGMPVSCKPAWMKWSPDLPGRKPRLVIPETIQIYSRPMICTES